MSERELDRLRAEYRARDAATETPYRWDNPGYVSYMQLVERALLRAFRDAGVLLAGARVLDVGCGGGYFLHRLSEYGADDCHGIDLMEARIDAARTRYPALSWHVGSATELPFEDGSFDLVTQFTCLSSIVDDAARSAAAGELRRVAGSGWVLSLDLCAAGRAGATPTVALDRDELVRLLGEPRLLWRVGLRFDVAQILGRHQLVAATLAQLRPLRSHLLGLWSDGPRGTAQ